MDGAGGTGDGDGEGGGGLGPPIPVFAVRAPSSNPVAPSLPPLDFSDASLLSPNLSPAPPPPPPPPALRFQPLTSLPLPPSPPASPSVEFSRDPSFQRPSSEGFKSRRESRYIPSHTDDKPDASFSPSRGHSADGGLDLDLDDIFLGKEDLNALLIFTKSVRPPSPWKTMRELRFLGRAAQLAAAISAFVALSVASFDVNYPSTIIGTSGINFMCATSVSSMMVSFSAMFLYLFPHLLSVPPVRHYRFSRVEVVVDLFWVGFWIAASSIVAVYGNCPRKFFDPITKDNTSCVPWNVCMIMGFGAAVFYIGTFSMGAADLRKYGWGYATGKVSANEGWVGWARGNWAQEVAGE